MTIDFAAMIRQKVDGKSSFVCESISCIFLKPFFLFYSWYKRAQAEDVKEMDRANIFAAALFPRLQVQSRSDPILHTYIP